MDTNTTARPPSKTLVITAFASLYIIWGSTYLGIMYAIRSIPPFFLVAARFLVAGSLLMGWRLYKGEKMPSPKTFAITSVGGVLMLFVGNGAVSWAEQYLPSGLAAIVVATVPLWFIMLDRSKWQYHFSNKWIIAGIIIGFAGVFILFAGKGAAGFAAGSENLVAFGVLIAGTIGWAIGSLYSKYKQTEGSVTLKAAMQMLSAGIVALAAGFISGENKHLVISAISAESWWALLYLTVMGSLVGFMSYIWLLSVRPAAQVGTYAYVNPVVAVSLGWFILHENVTIIQFIALLIILSGVLLVNRKPI